MRVKPETLEAALEQIERLEHAIWSIIDTFDTAVAHHENRGRGGQHTNGGPPPFSNVSPSLINAMRREAMMLRSALHGDWPQTKKEFVAMWGGPENMDAIDEMFKEREP